MFKINGKAFIYIPVGWSEKVALSVLSRFAYKQGRPHNH